MPHTGTPLIPSIENKEGCKAVAGEWDDLYHICLTEDDLNYGQTAPIKGAIFYWDIHEIGEFYLSDEERKNTPMYIGYRGGSVALDMSTPLFVDIDEHDDWETLVEYMRHSTLDLAKDVKEGKANLWGLDYYTKDGSTADYTSRDAIVSDSKSTVRRAYKEIEKHRQNIKPFKIDRWRQKT
jgi:hypothetical protein